MSLKRIKIINDTGLGYTTQVVEEATGAVIQGVREVHITLSVDDIARAELFTNAPRIDTVAYLTRTVCTCPYCGHTKETDHVKEN